METSHQLDRQEIVGPDLTCRQSGLDHRPDQFVTGKLTLIQAIALKSSADWLEARLFFANDESFTAASPPHRRRLARAAATSKTRDKSMSALMFLAG
jgi:hypothetical protein